MHLKHRSLRIRSTEGSKGGLLLLLVTSAAWGTKVSKISAADSHGHPYVENSHDRSYVEDSQNRPYVETTDHPQLEPKDLKSAVCLKCHSAKSEGKYVHTAVQMGCENCHQAIPSDDRTVMTLSATGGDLCAKCHEFSKNPILHEPYKAGQCLICHDPHSTDYPAHVRADGNALCLSCHMPNQPDARVDAQTGTVSLFDSQIYDLASWQSAPKIALEHPGNSKQSKSGEPPAEREAGKPAPETPCVSCHDPHAGKSQHLLRSGTTHRTERGSHEFPSGFMGLTAVQPDALLSQSAFARGLM